jgi:hypothetical protein
MTKVKYFTKDTLILANQVAIATDRNRSLYEDKLNTLPPGIKFPIGFTMIHNDVEMRVQIAIAENAEGDGMNSVWLDIPFETFNALPEIEVSS